MPQKRINHLMELWAAHTLKATRGESSDAPFDDYTDLHEIINSIPLGDVAWRCFTVLYNGPRPEDLLAVPSWMNQKYEVWFRCPRQMVRTILSNPEFNTLFSTAPYQEYTAEGKRKYSNLFSGNWTWRQAVCTPIVSSVVLLLTPISRTRTLLQRMMTPTALCSHRLFLEAIRPQCLSLLVRPNIIHSISLLATFIITLAELIAMGYLSWPFYLF